MKVSAARLIIGIALLVAVLVLSGKLSNLLDHRIARRTHINAGLRYTIARLLRYLLLTIGIVAVLKGAFLLDLTSLAIVFTALSVGIGFGLQYIAADIASGFILLFERPIRVGDRITIGEDEGDVQSIKLRTTVIYTNDRIAIIVPNSRLVSQRVGDYTLDFRLLIWTRQPSRHPQIKSDINYRIERLFRERRIEIPYPTQEFLWRQVKPSDDASELTLDRSGPEIDNLDRR